MTSLNDLFGVNRRNQTRQSHATIHSVNKNSTVNLFFEGMFIPQVPMRNTSAQGSVSVTVYPSGQIRVNE